MFDYINNYAHICYVDDKINPSPNFLKDGPSVTP